MTFKKLPKLYRIGIRYPKTVLAVSLVLSVVSLFYAKGLKIETSLTAMAPKNSESIRTEDEYTHYFGSTSLLIVTIENPDPAVAERFADGLFERAEKLPAVAFIDYRRPVDYFKKRQWLYLDLDDLKEIDRRVERVLKLEKKGVSMAFGDLMDFGDEEDRPELKFDDLLKKYENRPWKISKFDADEGGNLIAMRVKVKQGGKDAESASQVVDAFKSIERDLKAQDTAFRSVEVGYTGTLQATIEESDQIKREMAIVAAAVGLVLVFIILFYFRRWESVLLVGFPLVIGIVWTGGFVFLFLKHLNLMTSFAGGILAGLGSDYGIYLLTRYYSERGNGRSFADSCRLAFERTGTATYASMVTTVGAFAALLFSKFGVFFEFGLLGALGVILNYIAMMTVLPAILVFFDRFHVRSREGVSLARSDFFSAQNGLFVKAPVTVIVLTALLVGVAAFTLPAGSKIHFEEDMMVNRALPANRLYDKIDRIKGAPLAPTILITKGRRENERIIAALDDRVRRDADHKLVFDQVIGLSTFFPKQAEEKKTVLSDIAKKVSRLRWLPKNQKTDWLASLGDSMTAEPVTDANLPKEVKRVFTAPNDPDVFTVYLFPSVSRLTSQELTRYHREILDLKASSGFAFDATDGTFAYDDIVRLITHEAPRGMILICVFLAAVMYVLSRSVKRTAITLANLLGSLVLLSALLVIAKIRLNVMNIATIPVILGTGIDSFIHFAQRFDESHSMDLALREKIPAIASSNLTTIVGFAGLLLVSNPGLRSVGWVAVLGLVLVTVLCAFVYPRCLGLEGGGDRELSPDALPSSNGARSFLL